MSSIGICYIAYGEKAILELEKSIECLNGKYEFVVISDKKIKGYKTILNRCFQSHTKSSRWSKVNLNHLSPFEHTLYLDVDTRIRQDIHNGFLMLKDGYEFCLTFSQHQNEELLWHIGKEDKEHTLTTLEFEECLQLQAGVFWFRKCKRIDKLFLAWRQEWCKFENQDQGALLRALYKNPVKLWLLGRCWNGGAIINHLFGRIRR